MWCSVAVWLSGNVLVSINVVALRLARLVSGWVTICGYTVLYLVFNQSHPGLLNLAIPPWLLGRHNEYWQWSWPSLGKKRRVLRNSRPCYQDC